MIESLPLSETLRDLDGFDRSLALQRDRPQRCAAQAQLSDPAARKVEVTLDRRVVEVDLARAEAVGDLVAGSERGSTARDLDRPVALCAGGAKLPAIGAALSDGTAATSSARKSGATRAETFQATYAENRTTEIRDQTRRIDANVDCFSAMVPPPRPFVVAESRYGFAA